MRERALELRVASDFAHDLGAEEGLQGLRDVLGGDFLEHTHRGRCADRGSELGDVAWPVRGLSVDPGDEKVLERRWE